IIFATVTCIQGAIRVNGTVQCCQIDNGFVQFCKRMLGFFWKGPDSQPKQPLNDYFDVYVTNAGNKFSATKYTVLISDNQLNQFNDQDPEIDYDRIISERDASYDFKIRSHEGPIELHFLSTCGNSDKLSSARISVMVIFSTASGIT